MSKTDNILAGMAENLKATTALSAKIDSALSATDSRTTNTPKEKQELRLWRATSAISILIGIASSFYGLRGRVSVSSGDALDPDNVFATTFIVSNDSPLPIYNVKFGCNLGWFQFKNGSIVRENSPDVAFRSQFQERTAVAAFIRPGQKATINRFCPDGGYPVDKADITLVVIYDYFALPQQKRTFRLFTVKGADGKSIWIQQPR